MKKLIPLLLLVSCGQPIEDYINLFDKPVKKARTNSIFLPYIESFSSEFNVKVSVPIVLKKLKDSQGGVCITYSSGYREIQINSTYWDYLMEEQKEQLLYHELGHCVLNRKHDTKLMPNSSCPNSIMYPYVFSKYDIKECYIPEYNHYMEELK